MTKLFVWGLLAVAALLSRTPPCWAQTEGAAGSPAATAQCKALESADFSHTQDAPTQIIGAKVVEANGKEPAFCQVRAYVWPQIGFEVRLPMSNWNGKFLEVGSGGWGGPISFLFFCDGPLRRGYACIASNMGHTATMSQALWAANNLQAQVDYGFRATHVVALAGKAIVRSYYGKIPSKSIMFGCSTGGYQGMVEAQRFPWDFNGIVALAPDMDGEADLSMRMIWQHRNLFNRDGNRIFSPSDLQLLHSAALAKCDMTDDVKDGIVGDPMGCEFDPSVLLCKAGQKSGCLTLQQVEAAKREYSGPMTSKGKRISTRGLFPGSELNWYFNDAVYAIEFFKYAIFAPFPRPDWKPTDFDFDRDYKQLGLGALYNDSNPDLRKFKAAGGKLIVAQGGNDTMEIPGAIFDYYKMVERVMGGPAATQDFFRLFVVPGMEHCSGDAGAFAIDYLSYLNRWVEHGQAPDVMVGAHVKGLDWGQALHLIGEFPLAPSTPISFTRPVYPYPLRAVYKGTGNPNEAKNFKAVGP